MRASSELPDLSSRARVGGRALFANDEFFAPRRVPGEAGAGRLRSRQVHRRAASGWTAGRRAGAGRRATTGACCSWGCAGASTPSNVDTSFFVGNQPEKASLEACDLPGRVTRKALERAPWLEVLSPAPLAPGASNLFPLTGAGPFTHVRLNIFPDGGVARLRVRGEVAVDVERLRGRVVDLAAIENGGIVLARERHALRLEGAPDPAGPGEEHGRGLGDATTRAGPATTGPS